MELMETFKQAINGETMRKAIAYSLEELEMPKEVVSDKAAPPSSRENRLVIFFILFLFLFCFIIRPNFIETKSEHTNYNGYYYLF
jgi:hypothetical protein